MCICERSLYDRQTHQEDSCLLCTSHDRRGLCALLLANGWQAGGTTDGHLTVLHSYYRQPGVWRCIAASGSVGMRGQQAQLEDPWLTGNCFASGMKCRAAGSRQAAPQGSCLQHQGVTSAASPQYAPLNFATGLHGPQSPCQSYPLCSPSSACCSLAGSHPRKKVLSTCLLKLPALPCWAPAATLVGSIRLNAATSC